MRARPRTWPSIRFSRFNTALLAFACMTAIYPYRVSVSRGFVMDHAAHRRGAKAPLDEAAALGQVAFDPVCGMAVDPQTSKHRHVHAGEAHHFCSAGCRSKFAADPAKYLAGGRAHAPQHAGAGTIYTCPMHPEIRQGGPGSCPICGMALEPEAGGEDEGGELAGMTRRFWISAALSLPVVVLDMSGHFGFAPLTHDASTWVQLVLTTPVVLWGGWPFLVRGLQSVRTRHLNMFTLIALGTGVAYLYSLTAALAPGLFPPAFRDVHGGIALYFEAA